MVLRHVENETHVLTYNRRRNPGNNGFNDELVAITAFDHGQYFAADSLDDPSYPLDCLSRSSYPENGEMPDYIEKETMAPEALEILAEGLERQEEEDLEKELEPRQEKLEADGGRRKKEDNEEEPSTLNHSINVRKAYTRAPGSTQGHDF